MTGNVRPETMERITNRALADAFIEEQVKEVRAQVGDKKATTSAYDQKTSNSQQL